MGGGAAAGIIRLCLSAAVDLPADERLLIRCLQAQAAWREEEGRTLLLLPGMSPAEKAVAERLLAENPAVLPVTVQELAALLTAEEY